MPYRTFGKNTRPRSKDFHRVGPLPPQAGYDDGMFESILSEALHFLGVLAILLVSIVGHELTHGLVARIVRGRLIEVGILGEPALTEFSIRNVVYRIGWKVWTGGYAEFQIRGARWHRLRQWIAVAAGPSFNLALALASWWAYCERIGPLKFAFASAIINAATLLTNLNPFRFGLGNRELPTDGAQLLEIPLYSEERVRSLVAAAAEVDLLETGRRALDRNQIGKALEIFREGRIHHPENQEFTVGLIETIWEDDGPARAVETLFELQPDPRSWDPELIDLAEDLWDEIQEAEEQGNEKDGNGPQSPLDPELRRRLENEARREPR